jgi:hypothetical protein
MAVFINIKKYKKIIFKILFWLLVCCALGFITIHIFTKPRLNRDWSEDQSRFPEIKISGDKAEIKNIRNFDYSSISS